MTDARTSAISGGFPQYIYLHYSIPPQPKNIYSEGQKMEKEKFMEFVSKAYDMGAEFEVNFYQENFTEEFAEELAEEFAQIVGGEVKETSSDNSRWFKVYKPHKMAVFHQNSSIKKEALA